MSRTLLSAAATLALAGCGFVHDERLVGPYRLVAVDTDDQMMLCRDAGGNGDCSGDELGGETVFAAGANQRFITLAIHPNNNRSITAYYYLVRSSREAQDGGEGAVLVGPLDRKAFVQATRREGLPAFTRTFAALE